VQSHDEVRLFELQFFQRAQPAVLVLDAEEPVCLTATISFRRRCALAQLQQEALVIDVVHFVAEVIPGLLGASTGLLICRDAYAIAPTTLNCLQGVIIISGVGPQLNGFHDSQRLVFTCGAVKRSMITLIGCYTGLIFAHYFKGDGAKMSSCKGSQLFPEEFEHGRSLTFPY
jgi:hypothetical protein